MKRMLEVTDLTVSYGAISALRNVSLTVSKGEIVTVIGSNGAGKSTLLKAICGIVPSNSGRISFEAEDVTRLGSPAMVQRGVALVPEGRHVFPDMTVRENLNLGAYYSRDRAQQRADFEKALATFPILKERLSLRAGGLSGGQQQMLVIGRAMMSRPRLLMLDEPSLGLAPTIVQQLAGIIRDLNAEGTTVLLNEQNARMALKLASRAYVLATGNVVRTGTGQELLNDPSIRESYLGTHVH